MRAARHLVDVRNSEDDSTTLGELKDSVRRFCEERDWDRYHDAKNLAIGLVTEASELLAVFRFRSEEEVRKMLGDEAGRTKATDEVADVLYFLLRFAQMYGIDLSTEFRRKMRQNEAKYPASKARGSNKKYDELSLDRARRGRRRPTVVSRRQSGSGSSLSH